MPMIDDYAAAGTFDDAHTLAQDLAKAVMRWEQVPEISLFKNNTAAFVHDLPAAAIANAAGETNYVRVQVLTPANVFDRDKQIGVVRELTDIVAAAAGDPTLAARTWVLITESPEGGWASTATPTPVTTSLPRHAPSLARSPQPNSKPSSDGSDRREGVR